MAESYSSGTSSKPRSWGNLSAPPVWGQGANGTDVHKPDFHAGTNTPMPSFLEASSKDSGAATTAVAIAPLTVAAPVVSAPGVYDATAFVARRPDTTVARTAVSGTIKRAALWFFLTAGAGAVTWYLYRDSSAAIAMGGAFDCIAFGLIGFFAYRMSRIAFLAALAIYGLGTLAMLAAALMTGLPLLFFLKPLIVRCGFLYKHFRNYGLLTDLHLLENE